MQLRDRAATRANGASPPDDAVLATAPDFACETCGAAMQRGQDWCLECGTAAPGRLGQKPGWRAASTVVGLSALLLCCALIATYAALTSDAERTASAPPAGSAAPVVAAPDTVAAVPPAGVVTPGATGPGVTAPPAAPVSPTPLVPTPNPAQGATNTPVTPPPVTPPAAVTPPAVTPPPAAASNGTGTGSGSNGTTAAASTEAVTITFKKDAAQTYDPIKRAGAEFGPPEDAIDAKTDTVWDVTVPADGQPIDAGLVIDLGKPYALRSLRLDTPTDGFTLEIYGAKSAKQLPEDVIDKRWIHLTDKKFVLDGEPILLKGKGGGVKVQLLLLHIRQAADPDDPHVAIGNVTLRGTP